MDGVEGYGMKGGTKTVHTEEEENILNPLSHSASLATARQRYSWVSPQLRGDARSGS